MDVERDVCVAGLSSYLPGKGVKFSSIDSVLGKLDSLSAPVATWMKKEQQATARRQGDILYYYALDPATGEQNETALSMCTRAAKGAIDEAGLDASDIELVIFAGNLLEQSPVSMSSLIQDELDIACCAEYSILSGDTALHKATQLATQLIRSRKYGNALIVTAQLISPFLKADFLNQAVAENRDLVLRWRLCDGAGAMVLTGTGISDQPCKALVKDSYVASVGLGLGPDLFGGTSMTDAISGEAKVYGRHHINANLDVIERLAPRLARQALGNLVSETDIDLDRVKCLMSRAFSQELSEKVISSITEESRMASADVKAAPAGIAHTGPVAALLAIESYLSSSSRSKGDLAIDLACEYTKWMHGGIILECI